MIAVIKPEGSVYEVLAAVNPNAMVAKGMTEAYVGCSVGSKPVAVYDYETCVDIVMHEQGMNHSQAVAYLAERVIPDEHGPNLPIFVIASR